MHILVTNDDGVQAPGLLALAQAMQPLGKVTVFAPDRNWSASGHVKTLERPLRVHETMLVDGTMAFSSDGAPSDCVALPLLGFVEKVDLVVSGINPFSNIGHDVTYSGTVTAAMEAVIAGVPGIVPAHAARTIQTCVAANARHRPAVCCWRERGRSTHWSVSLALSHAALDRSRESLLKER